MKKYEFIDRIIYIIREKLENNLSNELTLVEMIKKTKELIRDIVY